MLLESRGVNGHTNGCGTVETLTLPNALRPLAHDGLNGLKGAQHNATRPRNRVLAGLPTELWTRIEPHLSQTLLIQGKTVIQEGRPVERVYFPNCGLLSLVMCGSSGERVETGLAGQESLAGAFEALQSVPSVTRAVVQIAGTAFWLPAEVFRSEFNWAASLQEHLSGFFHWHAVQAAQYALCNRFHCVEERLARWLLRASDHVQTDELFITHEAIAQMLGTRRSGVTVALCSFEQAGVISCGRGRLTILDRDALHKHSCECYDALHSHALRLPSSV